jgi:ribonuclease D
VLEDCLALGDKQLYEPDPAQAWFRLRGLAQLPPAARARAKIRAVWREKLARGRDLPRAWILPDAAIFSVAQGSAPPLNDALAASLEAVLEAATDDVDDLEPSQDARPSPEQKALIERLGKIVDARAAELNVSAEILAPRGELKALAMGSRTAPPRESHALAGWRRVEIGTRLLEAIG